MLHRLEPGLAGWLAITTAGLVAAAVASVYIVGTGSLRQLAEAEAVARVELAAASARDQLRLEVDNLLKAARLLASRPTLRQLVDRGDLGQASAYLDRYCAEAGLDGCAVVTGDQVTGPAGNTADWAKIESAAHLQGDTFCIAGTQQVSPTCGARARNGDEEGLVYVLRTLDAELAARLGEGSGLETRFLGPESSAAGPSAAGFGAVVPVTTPTGEVIASIETRLPPETAFAPVAELQKRLLMLSVIIAVTAIGSGLLIGRRWIRDVRQLMAAAGRLGKGILDVPVPIKGGPELRLLTSTMEEMRCNLLALTGEIRRREAQAQAVLTGIVEGVFAVDRKRRIRFLNTQAERLLSVSQEDVIGRFCGDVLRPAAGADGHRPCDSSCPILVARSKGSAELVEYIDPVGGQRRRVVVASAADNDGIQVQVLRDETELEAVRRARDTVLANISHEFRTPLAAQLASIELLRDGLDDMPASSQRSLVSSLERGAQRLTRLIDNLLESVRIEAGQLSIRKHDVRLADVAERAGEMVQPLLDQRGQRLLTGDLQRLPSITGDGQRLVQVFVNLLANAGKFAPPDSIIRIGGQQSDGQVLVWVEDDGAGPEDPGDTRLFEPFRRAGRTDPEESGLGLGLFIVKSIVERHGGRVWIERTAQSTTRATVALPGVSAN